MTLKTYIAAACSLAIASAASAGLGIGDQAPDLGKDVTWIKGASVTEFQEGHVYVLDFWATWCAPCIRAIPHMDDTAEKYEDDNVTVIGVAIWPNSRMTPTAQFVEDKGDDMSYTIAADINGATAKKFMEATNSRGIPTVMIVDRAGRLAWIGHPLDGMDEALAQVVAGTYDTEGAAEKHQAVLMLEQKAEPLMNKARAAYASEDWRTFVDALKELSKLDPKQYGAMSLEAFKTMLTKLNDPDAAYAYAGEIMAGELGNDPMALNGIAWIIVDESGVQRRDFDLAHKAAAKAAELSGHSDPNILDTLAAVYFHQGDLDKAIQTQRKAVESSDAEFAKRLQLTLDKYIAAANEG